MRLGLKRSFTDPELPDLESEASFHERAAGTISYLDRNGARTTNSVAKSQFFPHYFPETLKFLKKRSLSITIAYCHTAIMCQNVSVKLVVGSATGDIKQGR